MKVIVSCPGVKIFLRSSNILLAITFALCCALRLASTFSSSSTSNTSYVPCLVKFINFHFLGSSTDWRKRKVIPILLLR